MGREYKLVGQRPIVPVSQVRSSKRRIEVVGYAIMLLMTFTPEHLRRELQLCASCFALKVCSNHCSRTFHCVISSGLNKRAALAFLAAMVPFVYSERCHHRTANPFSKKSPKTKYPLPSGPVLESLSLPPTLAYWGEEKRGLNSKKNEKSTFQFCPLFHWYHEPAVSGLFVLIMLWIRDHCARCIVKRPSLPQRTPSLGKGRMQQMDETNK